jgi:AraC-like DNA-binding protein
VTDIELQRLSSFRTLIEGFGARCAATQLAGNDGQIGVLREISLRLNKAARSRDYESFRKADAQLHETIMNAAGVPYLRDVWRIVWDGLAEFHERGFTKIVRDPRTLIGEHDHLVKAIALSDPAAAEDAARCHTEANWARLAARTHTTAKGTEPLHFALAHISAYLHCPLRLGEVASKIAFTSPGNLSRLFRQHHGMSFNTYLQKLRMEKAAELLVTTGMSVTMIAHRVGYRDVSRFGQHFRRRHGMAPRDWRKGKRPKG